MNKMKDFVIWIIDGVKQMLGMEAKAKAPAGRDLTDAEKAQVGGGKKDADFVIWIIDGERKPRKD